jgi:hypothetical protein
LKQPAYKGTFVYNRRKSGQFYFVDESGEVVTADKRRTPAWQNSDVGVIKKEGAYAPLIEPAVWDAAQKRLAGFATKGRRPRQDGYPLSGVLLCGHCGKPMYGCQPTGRDYRVYRCSTNAKCGMGTCGCYEIREALILPFVLRLLGEEIDGLSKLNTPCPVDLAAADAARDERRAELEHQTAALRAKIDKATENLMFADDARTRQLMDAKLKEMWSEHDRLKAELDAAEATPSGPTADDLTALAAWWEDFNKRSVYVPLDPAKYSNADAYAAAGMPVPEFLRDAADSGQRFVMQCDRRAVNEALHGLGAAVKLRWRTEQVKRGRKLVNRHHLERGRFTLGQKKGDLSGHVLQSAGCGTVQLQLRRGSLR